MSPGRSRWTHVRSKAYPPEKERTERRNNVASFLVYRPLSWPLTLLAYRLGIRAMDLTFLALGLSCVGLCLIVAGQALIGFILINASLILDQADGSLARLTDSATNAGAWLDGLVGFLNSTFPLLAGGVGMMLSHYQESFAASWLVASDVEVGVIAVAGTCSIVIRKIGVETARRSGQNVQAVTLSSTSQLVYVAKAISSFQIIVLSVSLMGFMAEAMIVMSVFQITLMIVVMGLTYRAQT